MTIVLHGGQIWGVGPQTMDWRTSLHMGWEDFATSGKYGINLV